VSSYEGIELSTSGRYDSALTWTPKEAGTYTFYCFKDGDDNYTNTKIVNSISIVIRKEESKEKGEGSNGGGGSGIDASEPEQEQEPTTEQEQSNSNGFGQGASIGNGEEEGVHRAYVGGYEDGEFRADREVSREEFAAMVYRLMLASEREKYETATHGFADVEEGRWSERAIATLVNAGLIYGYENNEFRPNKPITRSEIAAICSRLGNGMLAGVESIKKHYADLTEEHWAYDEVIWVSERGWMMGVWEEEFCPDANITRAQVVTTLNRILGRTGTTSSHLFRDYADLSPTHWAFYQIQEASVDHSFINLVDSESWL
jgi:hypothetical protein